MVPFFGGAEVSPATYRLMIAEAAAALVPFERNHRILRHVRDGRVQMLGSSGTVTTLAGIYHACHRELCSHERDWPFEVVNFLELVGESMGFHRPDLFKRLKIMQDVDAVLAAAAPMIGAHHLDLDEARAVVLKDMLDEQPLPRRG